MKKLIALLLAAIMCLSLVACGSNGETSNNNQSETTEYAIGEAFGTDNVECIVTGIKWVTRPGGKFCVSVFRQNQEYHVFNVHDGGLFPLVTSLPEGWDGMRADTA